MGKYYHFQQVMKIGLRLLDSDATVNESPALSKTVQKAG
jgi:hypothetical protein